MMKFCLTFPPKAVLPISVAKLLIGSQCREQWKGTRKMGLLFVTIEASDVSFLPTGGLAIKIEGGFEIKENHGNGSRVLEILSELGKILVNDRLCQQCYELKGEVVKKKDPLLHTFPEGFINYECGSCHSRWVAKEGLRI